MKTPRFLAAVISVAIPALFFFVFTGIASAKTTEAPGKAIETPIAADGRALLPIVLSNQATEAEQQLAQDLKTYLDRISNAKFVIQPTAAPIAANTPGIVLGIVDEFTQADDRLHPEDATCREDYTLRSTGKALYITGATQLGLEHGVWDFLYKLGYRQFFPGEKWEYVPSKADLRLAVNVLEHPDYLTRRIWFGWGSMPENLAAFDNWKVRNRVALGIELNNNHSYATIIMRNKAEFDAHSEYYAQIDGKRAVWNGAQFCISNAGLRKLVVEDALRQLEKDPTIQCISVEPNDGGGWCQCENCARMGSVTDRVVTLANEVATAVTAKYPDKFVGMLAYNEHSPPPDINVHPHVVVNIATGFIRGGYTLDQLLEGWSQHAQIIGIYDYYSFVAWDWNMPGMAKAGNLEYMKTAMPKYYDAGARFMVAESSDNWGPNGLGYYVASRLLWDTKEAPNVDGMAREFLEKMFGAAKEPMAQWYRMIDGSNKPLLTMDLVGKMYRLIGKSLKMTTDPAIHARLYDLALYTRFVEYGIAPQHFKAPLEESMRFAWRIRATEMIHTRGAWAVMEKSIPPEADNSIPEPKNPWKSSEPFTQAEIEKYISDGIASNPVVDFTEVQYSRNLVPATPLKLGDVPSGDFGFFRGSARFYTWVDKAPTAFPMEVQSGVSTGPVEGDADLALFSSADPAGGALSDFSTPRDNKGYYPQQLTSNAIGLMGISLNDGTAGTRLKWPEGTPITFESGAKWQHSFQGLWTMYFYVPKNTKVLGGYKSLGTGQVVGPDGKVKLTFNKDEERIYWSVPVGPGEDGKLWLLKDIGGGEVRLLTVPPYLARSAKELLLPKEVVEADQTK